MIDVEDVAMSQAIVCAYAVPVAGPVAAGVLSILQAVYNAVKPEHVPGEYSPSQALADLGTKMARQLYAMQVADELGTIQGWQLDVTNADASAPAYAIKGAGDFLADHDFNTIFGKLLASEPKTDERVKSLGVYFLARITFHSLCHIWLDKLEKGRHLDPVATATLYEEISGRYLRSLTDAVAFTRDTVAALDESITSARAQATGKSDKPIPDLTDAMAVNLVRAQQLRKLRQDGHAKYATQSDVHKWQQYIVLFDTTIAQRQKIANPRTLPPTPAQQAAADRAAKQAAEAAAAGRTEVVDPSTGSIIVYEPIVHVSETRTFQLPTLGPRPAGVARFLFESAPAGGWVDVLDDSAVSPGPLVTQDAGSNDAGLYYRIDGGGLNGIFADLLDKADQRAGANADLVTAYDARWGAGAYAADSAGSPPRQDRLTSFLVLLANGVPPIGESVYGVLYSVGPHLRDKGIEDTDAYKKIYTDGLAAIAEWNRTNTPFVNLRLALLSTGIYGGDSRGPALNAQAAGLIVDAVVAAMKTMPELAALTLLVNTNDTPAKDGDERIAFETVARARSIPTTRQGFDVSLSS